MSEKTHLTEPQIRALKVLRRIAPKYEDGTSAKWFAKQMWPDSDGWRTLSKVNNGVVRGKAMPGLAGRLLWRLNKMGLVYTCRPRRGYGLRWYISRAGKKALEELGH